MPDLDDDFDWDRAARVAAFEHSALFYAIKAAAAAEIRAAAETLAWVEASRPSIFEIDALAERVARRAVYGEGVDDS